ncbi:MAG: group III truncated hemoglobin [Allorhizobium sp.]
MDKTLTGRAAHMAEISRKAEAAMTEIGVDAAFVDLLVETFYERIQAHPILGPVFDARLTGRWPDHMAKMKRFWSAIAFKNGAYGGKPVQAHTGINGMQPALFTDWLTLFSATLDDIAPTPEAKAWFMTSAERIARSLIVSLSYNPALDDPARGTPEPSDKPA